MKRNLKFILLSFFALLFFSCGTILLTHDFSPISNETEVEVGNDEEKIEESCAIGNNNVFLYVKFPGTDYTVVNNGNSVRGYTEYTQGSYKIKTGSLTFSANNGDSGGSFYFDWWDTTTLKIDGARFKYYNGSGTMRTLMETFASEDWTLWAKRSGWFNDGCWSSDITINSTSHGREIKASFSTMWSQNYQVAWVDLYVTLYQSYINFVSNGGSYCSRIYQYGGQSISLPAGANAPTKEGYTFAGWYESSSFSGSPVSWTTMPSTAKTLYAKWTPNKYDLQLTKGTGISTIYYKVNGASSFTSTTSSATIKVDYDSTWYAYATATTGYSYTAYSSSNAMSGQMGMSGASYSPVGIPNTYKVQYLGGGSTGGSTAESSHTYGTAKNLTANGFKREYTVTYNHNYTGSTDRKETVAATFNRWSCDKGGTYSNKQSVINLTSTNGDTVKMTAQWSFGSITHTSPSRTGYTFGGWYKEAACTNKAADSCIVNSNMTFYAKWTANRYKLTLNINGATTGSNKDIYTQYDSSNLYNANTGTTLASITNPTRNGYKFKGWTITKDGNDILIDTSKALTYIDGKDYTNSSKIWKKTAGVTLYAKWEVNLMTIKYHLNGGTIVSGNTYFEQNDPAKTETWAYNKESIYGLTNPSSDRVTKTGYYANTIYYNTQADGKGKNVSFKGSTEGGDGTKLDKATDIANAAGKLSDFNTGDITVDLYIIWNLTQYTITYTNTDGATVSPANNTSYTIESTTFTLNNPVKQGYIFSGWTGSNGNTAQTSVSIAKGSTGSKTFKANWIDTWANHATQPQEINGVWQVSTKENLAWVANEVNFNNNNAISVKLTSNINLSDHEWYPIGTADRAYCGEFNGNGYQITGLKTNSNVNNGYAGLFGYIGSKVIGQNVVSANIHNVSLSGATVNGIKAGGLVGYAKAGTIKNNIVYNSTINGTTTGGIVGEAASAVTIDSNLFTGTLSGTTKGLIAGKYSGTITNCLAVSSDTSLKLNPGGDRRSCISILNGTTNYSSHNNTRDDFTTNWKEVSNMFSPMLPSGLFWIASW